MNTEDSRIILNDYKEWLPELAKSHNADSSEIDVYSEKIMPKKLKDEFWGKQ